MEFRTLKGADINSSFSDVLKPKISDAVNLLTEKGMYMYLTQHFPQFPDFSWGARTIMQLSLILT
jgi:hypothetical protein